DAAPDAPGAAGDEHDPAAVVERSGGGQGAGQVRCCGVGWVVHDASSGLPCHRDLTHRQIIAARGAGGARGTATMPITTDIHDDGVAEVVVDVPPVNALPVAGWFELAGALERLGRDPAVRVVVLRAEGRGFNAGVDIKEMQATEGFDALVGANRGCFAAFAAVYDCPVPVLAGVRAYCLGGGIGLVGNADIVVASEDATCGLPEVDRGALGAATHLARVLDYSEVPLVSTDIVGSSASCPFDSQLTQAM